MPADQILVSAPNRDENPGNSDYVIRLRDNFTNGIPLPANLTIDFRIEPDGLGGFRSIVESNYTTEQLRQIILMNMSVTVGK